MSDVLTLPIRSVTAPTPLTRLLRLDLGTLPFAFRAGQAAWLGQHGQTLRRPYSIASSPDDARRHRRIEFLIRVDERGSAGPHLPALEPGARVDFEGPVGSFTLSDDAPAYLFVAGGTGIAPLRSMLRHLIASQVRVPIGLLYSARSVAELAFRTELERLARRGLITLVMTVTGEAGGDWAGARGRITLEHLRAALPDPRAVCYLCGPPALVEAVPPLLRELGVASGAVRVEGRVNGATSP